MTTSRERGVRGLGVTLVTADSEDGAGIIRRLGAIPPSQGAGLIESPDATSADFAVDLAEKLAADVEAGASGETFVLLDAEADVVEVALVLERLLENWGLPRPVGVCEIIAITSVRDIVERLFPGRSQPDQPDRTDYAAPGRLASRLEFATMIALTDDVGGAAPVEAALVKALLAQLAPSARVMSVEELDAAHRRSALLVRGRAHRLGASMGWQLALNGWLPSGSGLGPVRTFVFRDPRPFHPERLRAAVTSELTPARAGSIVRSRGFVRLATRPERIGLWSTAGDILDFDPSAMLSWDPESPIGQEIAFIGVDLNAEALQSALTSCLLTDEELAAGPEAWRQYLDDFPEWEIEHHH